MMKVTLILTIFCLLISMLFADASKQEALDIVKKTKSGRVKSESFVGRSRSDKFNFEDILTKVDWDALFGTGSNDKLSK